MSHVLACNRCGAFGPKPTEDNPSIVETTGWRRVALKSPDYFNEQLYADGRERKHLCPDCSTDFDLFMQNKDVPSILPVKQFRCSGFSFERAVLLYPPKPKF